MKRQFLTRKDTNMYRVNMLKEMTTRTCQKTTWQQMIETEHCVNFINYIFFPLKDKEFRLCTQNFDNTEKQI